jgi:hypothetical protein
MLRVHPQGSRTFKFQSRGCRDLASSLREARRAEGSGATTGSSGSIASGSGTENTTFASAWPTRRLTAKSGKDWSIGFAKCITSVSGAGVANDHNRRWIRFDLGNHLPVAPCRPRVPHRPALAAGGHALRPQSPSAPVSSSSQPYRPRARRRAPVVHQPSSVCPAADISRHSVTRSVAGRVINGEARTTQPDGAPPP